MQVLLPSSHVLQHSILFWFFCSIVSMKWYPIVIFFFISLITGEVGYLFICLWANCVFMHSTYTVGVPPMCRALLGSLLHFEISVPTDCPFFPLGVFLFQKINSLYALETSFVGYRFCKYCASTYLQINLCLAFLLCGIFWWLEAPNFNVVRSFFLYCFKKYSSFAFQI